MSIRKLLFKVLNMSNLAYMLMLLNASDNERPLTYKEAYDIAIKNNKPLVVFVNVQERAVEGTVVCRWDEYPNVQRGIVVGVKSTQNDMRTLGSIDASSSNEKILEEVRNSNSVVNKPLSLDTSPRYYPRASSYSSPVNYYSNRFYSQSSSC